MSTSDFANIADGLSSLAMLAILVFVILSISKNPQVKGLFKTRRQRVEERYLIQRARNYPRRLLKVKRWWGLPKHKYPK